MVMVGELTKLVRSKNAGPFWPTVEITLTMPTLIEPDASRVSPLALPHQSHAARRANWTRASSAAEECAPCPSTSIRHVAMRKS